MAEKQAGNDYRPMTSRQAKEKYRKSGGMPRISVVEMRRIQRAAELEERAQAIRDRDRRRKENRRKAEAKAQRDRAQRARMGLPDPVAPQPGPSQCSLNGRFDGRGLATAKGDAGADRRISGSEKDPIILSTEPESEPEAASSDGCDHGDTDVLGSVSHDLHGEGANDDTVGGVDGAAAATYGEQLPRDDWWQVRIATVGAEVTDDDGRLMTPPSLSWAFGCTAYEVAPQRRDDELAGPPPSPTMSSRATVTASPGRKASGASDKHPSPQHQGQRTDDEALDWGNTFVSDSQLIQGLDWSTREGLQETAEGGSPLDPRRAVPAAAQAGRETPDDVLAGISTQDLVLSSQ